MRSINGRSGKDVMVKSAGTLCLNGLIKEIPDGYSNIVFIFRQIQWHNNLSNKTDSLYSVSPLNAYSIVGVNNKLYVISDADKATCVRPMRYMHEMYKNKYLTVTLCLSERLAVCLCHIRNFGVRLDQITSIYMKTSRAKLIWSHLNSK